MAISMINAVDGYYASQADTRVLLTHLHLLENNGPMTATNANTLFDQFFNWMKNSSFPPRATAHLLSGKTFDNNIAGLGYLGTLCDPVYGIGINQAILGVASSGLIAHELGHNYSANHDNDGNDCPISGHIMQRWMSSNPPTTFTSCSLNYFSQFREKPQAQCLAIKPHTIFSDEFE